MKTLFALFIAVLAFTTGYSQDDAQPDINQTLSSFNRVVVSHKVNLVLIPGTEESIRVTYHGVDRGDIIIDQSGNRLHVYLRDAKFFDIGERRRHSWERRERYRFASVTAYVTFKDLRMVSIRGEGEVNCDGKIESKSLKVRAYGENEVRFAFVDAGKVKARLYGENKLRILDGDTGHLSYKVYGENIIDSRGLESVTASTTIYGEGRISLHSSEEVRVRSFGEPSLFVSGSPYISKGLMLGNARIRRN